MTPTDHAKLDAALASALEDVPAPEDRVLPVFVEVAGELPETARSVLSELGVAEPIGNVTTATLSARQVAELSDQPWVRYLRLSGRLRLLGDQ
ncbi:MAG TPA: hypothetical protein VHG90_08915 [Acidimicrobiales bacterium]|nr:hypothetical protein [Acidimicrobiales bacterium]